MKSTFGLILPALIPSWRFFETIEPSPRVQWAFVSEKGDPPADWHSLQPRPRSVAPLASIVRLFWNPVRNDALFVVSCAERIQQRATDHSIQEIKRRIQAELRKSQQDSAAQNFQFRLVFVRRVQTGLEQEILFTSAAFPVREPEQQ